MNNKEKKSLKDTHPLINRILGLIILLILVAITVILLKQVIELIGNVIVWGRNYVSSFVQSTDKVIIVAMITGSVSIVGVVISSVISKVVEYRYNVKKYLYDKREGAYEKFIEMVYTIMLDSKKEKHMTQEELQTMMSDFSKELTLWGSNKVVKKWLKYRRSSINGENDKILWQMEDMIYEIRKDVGLGRRLKKGDMLSVFINDIDDLSK